MQIAPSHPNSVSKQFTPIIKVIIKITPGRQLPFIFFLKHYAIILYLFATVIFLIQINLIYIYLMKQ